MKKAVLLGAMKKAVLLAVDTTSHVSAAAEMTRELCRDSGDVLWFSSPAATRSILRRR